MTAVRVSPCAKDIMTPEPVCVEPATTLRGLVRLLEEHEISGVPVIDPQGRVIGVVTKTDIIHRCTEGTLDVPPAYLFEVLSEQGEEDEEFAPEESITVEDLMTEEPATVPPDASAEEVARVMTEGRFHRVIVVDSGRFPLGIITTLDLLKVLASRAVVQGGTTRVRHMRE